MPKGSSNDKATLNRRLLQKLWVWGFPGRLELEENEELPIEDLPPCCATGQARLKRGSLFIKENAFCFSEFLNWLAVTSFIHRTTAKTLWRDFGSEPLNTVFSPTLTDIILKMTKSAESKRDKHTATVSQRPAEQSLAVPLFLSRPLWPCWKNFESPSHHTFNETVYPEF